MERRSEKRSEGSNEAKREQSGGIKELGKIRRC